MADASETMERLMKENDSVLAGSRQEGAMSESLSKTIHMHGLETIIQDFSYAGSTHVVVAAALALTTVFSIVSCATSGAVSVVMFVLALACAAVGLLEATGRQTVSRLLPTMYSQNVIARHPATPHAGGGAQKARPIVIIAHYDTPCADFMARPGLRKLIPYAGRATLVAVAVAMACSLLQLLPLPRVLASILFACTIVAGIIMVFTAARIVYNRVLARVTSGANDNMSGVTALLGVLDRVHPAVDSEFVSAAIRAQGQTGEGAPVDGSVPAEGDTREGSAAPEEAMVRDDAERRSRMRSTRIANAPVRRDAGVLRSLGMVPESCEIVYEVSPEARETVLSAPLTPAQVSADKASRASSEQQAEERAAKAPAPAAAPAARTAAPAPAAGAEAPAPAAQTQVQASAGDRQGLPSQEQRPAPVPQPARAPQAAPVPSQAPAPSRPVARPAQAQATTRQAAVPAAAVPEPAAPAPARPTTPQPGERSAHPTDEGATRAPASASYGRPSPAGSDTSAEKTTVVSPVENRIKTAPAASSLTPSIPGATTVLTHENLRAAQEREMQQRREAERAQMVTAQALAPEPSVESKPLDVIISSDEPDAELRQAPTALPRDVAQQQVVSSDDARRDSILNNPNWGTTSFTPVVSSRRVLEDVPDPSVAAVDPYSVSTVEAIGDMDPEDFSVLNFETGTHQALTPQMIEDARHAGLDGFDDIANDKPKSRRERKHKKNERIGRRAEEMQREMEEQSFSDWLGVDDDYDAQKNGRQIGTWDNFEDDARGGSAGRRWQGGAARAADVRDRRAAARPVPERPGDDAADQAPLSDDDAELRSAAMSLGDADLVSHEIWFVLTGASEASHAGARAFVREYDQRLHNAYFINLECVGAGRQSLILEEGVLPHRKADRRLVNLFGTASTDINRPLALERMPWRDTELTPALQAGRHGVTVCGVEDGAPARARWSGDEPRGVDLRKIDDLVDIIVETIRRS